MSRHNSKDFQNKFRSFINKGKNMAKSIVEQLEDLKTIRDGYLTALVADAANPQPSYSWEGVSVDRMTWREKLAAQIGVMNTMMNRVSPTEIRGQII
jgi:hypothetical protein